MRYRTLGTTGLTVSEVGFGAWGIGGTCGGAVAYGPTDDAESKQALRRAVELGVTFFDTSDLYGYGHSEELIGEALHEVRARIVIASKVGFLDQAGKQDFSPTHLRRALEGSLRRLRTDYVDLYQLHSPDVEQLRADGPELDALRVLQREGKVRALGIAVRSPEDGLAAVGRLGFRAVQVNFNLVDQRALHNGLFDLCITTGAGIIVRTPLCFGFLTGEYAAEDFGPGDHRSRWSRAQRARWADATERFAAIGSTDRRQTQAQAALRFCLSYGAVASVIPGMLTRTHVEENVAASHLGPLPAPWRGSIEHLGAHEDFFVGR